MTAGTGWVGLCPKLLLILLHCSAGVLSYTFISSYSGEEVNPPHPLGHSGLCTSGQVSNFLPCVLPVNANVTLHEQGAGIVTGVTVSIDIYPGPKCVESGSAVTEFDIFSCSTAEIDSVTYHTTEPALFQDLEILPGTKYRSVVRLILPKGFDGSQATLEGERFAIHDADANMTGIRYIPAKIKTGEPVQLGYGLTEPSPELVKDSDVEVTDGADGDEIVTRYRTGTTWGLRDPAQFDPGRVVDIMVDSPGSKTWELENDDNAGPDVVERVQRVKFELQGVRPRRAIGRIESAMAIQERVFGLQIYKWPESEVDSSQPDTSKVLLRYYNTRINDPCSEYVNRNTIDKPNNCPQLAGNMNWFNATNKTQLILQCPSGTYVVNGTADSELQCAPCDPGYISRVMDSACSICPPGTFADASDPAIEGAGAQECKLCGEGRSASAGSTACVDCMPGTFAESNMTGECLPCPKGTYSENYTTVQCEACPADSSTAGIAASQLSDCRNVCQSGTFGVGGVEPCFSCVAGTYSPESGASDCLLCAPGSTSNEGASVCEPCSAGLVAAGNGSSACEPCPVYSYAPMSGSSSCTVCPEDRTASEAGFDVSTPSVIGEAYLTAVAGLAEEIDYLLTRTNAVGSMSGQDCQRNCLPGEFSTGSGIDTHSAPCTMCAGGKFSDLVAATICMDCQAGSFAEIPGASSCSLCPAGTFGTLPGTVICGMCPPGSTSMEGSTSCSECPMGKYTPSPGSSSCLDCEIGTFSSQGASSCTVCPQGFTTVVTAATSFSDCISYSSIGAIAHWELGEASIGSDDSSRYSRMPRNEARCRETQPIDMYPTEIVDGTGNMGSAKLMGPLCRQGTEWDTPGGNGMNLGTFMATNGKQSVMQFDSVVNTGLVVGDIHTLHVQDQKLPVNSFAVEAWLTVEEAGASYSGVVGAQQKRRGYGKGWSLGHYMDANRDDALFFSFELAVQANDEGFNDFNQNAFPEFSQSRGGLFNIIGRAFPAPPLGSWVHVVAQYSATGPAQIFVNGRSVVEKMPCVSGGGCGPILYPDLLDYWGSRNHTLFTVGGVHDVDAGRFLGHRGLLSMVRVYNRVLMPTEVMQLYQLRRPIYAATTRLSPWYWSRSTELPLLSPDVDQARVDINALANFSDRFDTSNFAGLDLQGLESTVFQVLEFENVTLWGRFSVEQSYRCRWNFGPEVQNSVTGEILDSDGRILLPGPATATLGNRLRCRLPDWRYGKTLDAVLTVEQVGVGTVWQRVCIRESCGYVPPQRRPSNSGIWWIQHGMENLQGLKSVFEFFADVCPEGSFSPLGGVRPWCELCPEGYFADAEGSVSCKACGIGQYSSAEGSTSCATCPEGSSTATPGKSSAEDCMEQCPAGLFGGIGGIEPCIQCEKGTYSNAVGLTQCLQCAPGKSTLDPAEQTAEGVTECTDVCQPGYRGLGGLAFGGGCEACPPGFFSPSQGSQICSKCQPGYYSIAASADCVECPANCELAKLQGGNATEAALRDQCCLGAWS